MRLMDRKTDDSFFDDTATIPIVQPSSFSFNPTDNLEEENEEEQKNWFQRQSLFFKITAVLSLVLLLGGLFGLLRLDVMTSSAMGGSLPKGSLVFVRTESSTSITPGQIIVYIPPPPYAPTITIDRVATVGSVAGYVVLTTKEDSLPYVDKYHLAVKGTIYYKSFSIPYLGYILEFLRSGIMQFIFLILASVSLIAYLNKSQRFKNWFQERFGE